MPTCEDTSGRQRDLRVMALATCSVDAGKSERSAGQEPTEDCRLSDGLYVPVEWGSWSVASRGDLIEIGFGRDTSFPQYAAIHADTGYLRVNHGPGSDWGTSIVLPPSFWAHGRYYQGAVTALTWRSEGSLLRVAFCAAISSLRTRGEVRLKAPFTNEMSCGVEVHVHGSVDLDDRAGEAFKPVMLSSMHVSEDLWDVQSIGVDAKRFAIPENGRIVRPAARGRCIVLAGGRSDWKKHAPSIKIELDRRLPVTGWKTVSSNPDDDNIGVWAATDHVLRSWRYAVTVTPNRH